MKAREWLAMSYWEKKEVLVQRWADSLKKHSPQVRVIRDGRVI